MVIINTLLNILEQNGLNFHEVKFLTLANEDPNFLYKWLEYFLVIYDYFYAAWLSFVKNSLFYYFLLAGFEDYNLIIHTYLQNNFNMYTYPVILELYAEQLNFSFQYLELSYNSTQFENELKESMRLAHLAKYSDGNGYFSFFQNFPWSINNLISRNFFVDTVPVINDWYNYHMYLYGYYNYFYDLPLNFFKFLNTSYFPKGSFSGFLNSFEKNKTTTYGLEFDLSFYNFQNSYLFYGVDGFYDKYMSDTSLSKHSNNNLFISGDLKNFNNIFNSKQDQLNSVLIRNNSINTLGSLHSKSDLKNKTFLNYIESSNYHNINLENIRFWHSMYSDLSTYGTLDWWYDLQVDKYFLKYYQLLFFYEDYVNNLPKSDLFYLEIDDERREKYEEYFPLELRSIIFGASNRDFWLSFFRNTYDNYIWINTVLGSIHTFNTEPHLIEENLYNFIISKSDNSEINLYIENYSDFLKSRPKGQDSFYNMIYNMKESGLIQKLPLKTDNLIFFINMYEKIESFYFYYLDCRLFFYKFINLKETLNMYYSYFIWWNNPSEYSKFEQLSDEYFKSFIIYLKLHFYIFIGKWVYPFIKYIPWALFFSYVYFFSAFIKAFLPQNLGLYKNTSKFVKKIKNNKFDVSHKLNYNIEDIIKNEQNFAKFVSKLTNLEAWIFNLDINSLYKNSKYGRFLKIDTKSRNEYISLLKKNSDYIYQNFKSFESLKHYENSGKLNHNLDYIFLIGKRAKLKTLHLFGVWSLHWFKNLYFNLGRRGLTLDSFSKSSNILTLKWPEFITKFFQSYFVWPVMFIWFTVTWVLFLIVMRLIWKAKMPLFNFFSKRGSFNEHNWFKTQRNISKIFNNIELNLNDVNKELNRFRLNEYKKVNKFTSLKQRFESHIPVLRLQSTPGGRLYYFWNLLIRFFFILWNNIKMINIDINSKTFSWNNNNFIQKNKTLFYFIYLEYMFWRSNPLKLKIKNDRLFIFEYILIILFPLCFLLFPLILTYYFFFSLIYIYNKISFKFVKITTSVNNLIKIWLFNTSYQRLINFVEVIIYYFLLFWRSIFFDSKKNNGLIVRFYVNFFYKWLCNFSYFIYMVKGAYTLGSKQNQGISFVFNYIFLKIWVYLLNKFTKSINIIINQINININNLLIFINQINVNINHIYIRIINYEVKYLFEEFFYNFCRFTVNIIKYIFLLIGFTFFYIIYNLDFTYLPSLFYHIRLFYFSGKNTWMALFTKIINLRIFINALKIYWKNDNKSLVEFLLIQLIFWTPFPYYWKRTYDKIKIFKNDRFDGKGFIHSLSFFEIFGIKINIFNNYREKLHFFLYHVGLSSMLTAYELEKKLLALEKKRRNVIYKQRKTWLTTEDIFKLLSMRFYFFVVHYLNDKYRGYVQNFELAYRLLDNTNMTSHWPLWKRFRFLYLDFIRIMFNIRKYKFVEKKKDKFGYLEIKLAKKAQKIFILKAFFNFISLFIFKGYFKFTDISYFKHKFMPINMNLYLDYNVQKVSPYLWFLAVLYKHLYNNIFKYYYSGEFLGWRRHDEKRAFARLAWPGYINFSWIPLKSIGWVYNSGRFVIKILYSPVINWPLRMITTILGFLAKRSRSRVKKTWYKTTLESLDDINRDNKSEAIEVWNALMMLLTINPKNTANIDFQRFELNEKMGLGKYFVSNKEDDSLLDSYTKVKAEFEKSLNAIIDDNLYLEFIQIIYKNVSSNGANSSLFNKFYKKYNISLSDIFDYRFADFVHENYPENHPLKKKVLNTSKLIKAGVERRKIFLLDELERRTKKLKKLRRTLNDVQKNDLYYLQNLDIFSAKEQKWLLEIEEKLKIFETNYRDQLFFDKQDKARINWLTDSFYDIDADKKANLSWGIPGAFKIADQFYHWSSYITIFKLYVEWYSELVKESTHNNILDEAKILRRVWTNMLDNKFSDIFTDGGSAVNAYYSYAWDSLYNHYTWAQDDDFDFNAQMNERIQEVFLHNYYVKTLGPKYFSIYIPKMREIEKKRDWDTITHSPLHYNRYFIQYNKWGSIYRYVSYISLVSFLYVLFYWPGEYIVNNHLLIIPFGIWVISSIMYYYYYKPFNKIMKTHGIFRYKLDWRRHNPYAGDPDLTENYLKVYTSTYTKNNFFLWKDDYWGNIFWIFTFSWYFCEWYETDAFRHRWFPWDYTTEFGIDRSLQDIIHDDALDRLTAGKNYFSVPYANTFRLRSHMDLLTLDNEYDIKRQIWDYKVGLSPTMHLNDFIQKCTFYVKFFLCSDKARYKYPRTDITQCHLTPEESAWYMKYQLNNYLSTEKYNPPAFDSPTDQRLANLLLDKFEYIKNKNDRENKLLLNEEDSLSLYVNIHDVFNWFYEVFNNFINKIKYFYNLFDQYFSIWEKEGFSRFFSKDLQDRMDDFDYFYFHFSKWCANFVSELLQFFDFIIEILKNLF